MIGRPFKKGHIPWNKGLKGIHLSKKTEFKKGSHYSPKTEFKKGQSPWNKGLKGRHFSPMTEFKKGMTPWNKNKPFLQIRGEKHPYWAGNKIGYGGIHCWIAKYLIRPKICKWCGTATTKRFQWHNISRRYKRNPSDWENLCSKCHVNYHKAWLKRKWRKCKSVVS